MQYAGRITCPTCEAPLVHEYECPENAAAEALAQAEQRLVCRRCGYSRHVAYVVPRLRRSETARRIRH